MDSNIKILIIDDEEIVRECIKAFMENSDYVCFDAASGEEGLEIFNREEPDLIITDLNLPGISGFDIVETVNLKSANIPTIVISGGGMLEDSIKAIRLGAWDYITKPIFDFAELQHRVRNALDRARLIELNEKHKEHLEVEIKKRTAELRELNERLEQKVEERTQKLSEANDALKESLNQLKSAQEKLVESGKMAALGGLVAGVAHEINTPIGIGVTAASHLEEKTCFYSQRYKENKLSRKDFETFLSIATDSAKIILGNMVRAADLIHSFKKVAVDQSSSEQRRFKLKPYINEILVSLQPKLKNSRHSIQVDCDDDITLVSYPGAISQILTNFIMNSLKHGFDGMEAGQIQIEVKLKQDEVKLVYRDNGHGIPKENLKRIFDPFFTTKRGKGGSGLGMHIVYNLVTQTLKGEISCKSKKNEGTIFVIDIPREVSAKENEINENVV